MPFKVALKKNKIEIMSGIIPSMDKVMAWITITLMSNDVFDADQQLKKILEKKEEMLMKFKIEDFFILINKIDKCEICLGTTEDENENPNDWIEIDCKNKLCTEKLHKMCLERLMESTHSRCPYCNYPLGNEDNVPPFGEMTINKNSGFSVTFKKKKVDLIYIEYTLNYGSEHNTRRCYIPDTDEGNSLLDRLINAFKLGYVFRIGDSVTTGSTNTIVWGGIHHKTELSGIFGFPDDTYLDRLNTELKALNVLEPYQGQLTIGKRKVYDYRK